MVDQQPVGFINLNKPLGLTSHDCVGMLRRVLHTRKIGHGGTLDPDATGVLPIAVGRATRLISFLPSNKCYQATFQLGRTSTTDDASGEILDLNPFPPLTLEQVEAQLQHFQGTIKQVPPLFSAIKQQGKPLYQLARSGVQPDQIDRPPRSVRVDEIRILAWRLGEFPELELEITCGSGTYIRAIARDLGQALGCGGLMSQLIRLQSGPFLLGNSIDLDQLKHDPNPQAALISPQLVFRGFPTIRLATSEVERWCCGQSIDWDPAWDWADHGLGNFGGDLEPEQTRSHAAASAIVVLHQETNQFLGLGEQQSGMLKAIRVWN